MSLLKCCLKIILLLKFLKKRNRVECVVWISDRLLINSSVRIRIRRAMESK
ncbi:hypothetical protein Ahy_A06g029599 isoform B [Arachis hypogaea]|uniref:Uncharacterized protein n=1 Tax=Arachis hypogaea TaxID=3818 RepID=A0A445CTZ2_ARAHY|nr:hypothetical protein Ahy_A06g029599 isoform B [Arachis hypogaea]